MRLGLILPLLVTFYVSCGGKVEPNSPHTSPSVYQQLENRLDSLTPYLLTCDGGPTDKLGHNITGRPICDTGDSINPLGLLSITDPNNPEYAQYLLDSLGEDGRPYRSPEHRRACENSFEKDTNPNCSFSRDHLLGHMFYAVSTKDPSFLLSIYGYMERNDNKFCVGSTAQCGMTPGTWDALGDTFAYLSIPRPHLTQVPDTVSYFASIITAASNKDFQLSLVAEIFHLKLITNRLSKMWLPLIEMLVEKSPSNLYFIWLQNAAKTHSSEISDQVAIKLVSMIDEFLSKGSTQTVWAWSWIDEPYNYNAWSFIFLGRLVKGEIK